MSKRLLYGKNPPASLLEKLVFDEDAPYTIRYKKLENDDNAIMHYSDSVEINVYNNVSGHISIEAFGLDFSGNNVIVIPPNNIHAVQLKKGEGHVYCLHVSPKHLNPFIDLNQFLMHNNSTLSDLSYVSYNYDAIYSCVQDMIRNDDNVFFRISSLLQLFSYLSYEKHRESSFRSTFAAQNSIFMHELIEWTEQNYNKNITLSDAAKAIGFSKNYFCHWFKRLTGDTFNNYLNDVKIAKACTILRKTQSVSETCAECGFSDVSYFIQLFKKKTSLTPLQYLKRSTDDYRNILPLMQDIKQ